MGSSWTLGTRQELGGWEIVIERVKQPYRIASYRYDDYAWKNKHELTIIEDIKPFAHALTRLMTC
jgi:hypothetical protein